MKASLNFQYYSVLETHYRNNPFVEDAKERDITPYFEFRIEHRNKDKSDAGIFLSIQIGEKDSEDFYLEAQIFGAFNINLDEEMSIESKESMYRINAIAILFPYLRSLVSDITSKGSDGDQIILPPLNIQKMLGESSEELNEVEDEK
jgi:preprotein translocase subunit SecB